ncbi:hypothetical protein CANINC_004772, partial [Pichia inconspicua]
GTRGAAGQDPSLAAKATHVIGPLVEEASGNLSAAAAGPGIRHGGSSAGLGFEAGLGVGGGSPFGVGLGLGLGPRRLQAPNPPQGSDVDRPPVEEASGILSLSCSQAGKPHGELPGSMPSQPAPLPDPRRVVLSDVGIGSPWGGSLS